MKITAGSKQYKRSFQAFLEVVAMLAAYPKGFQLLRANSRALFGQSMFSQAVYPRATTSVTEGTLAVPNPDRREGFPACFRLAIQCWLWHEGELSLF